MKRIALLTLAFALCLTAVAQTAPAPSDGLSTTAGPLAINYQGQWSVASFTRQAYDVYDFGKTKANRVYAGSVQLIAPTPCISMYAGEATVSPDLSGLLKKTNMPAFKVAFSGAIGPSVPATGPSSIGWMAGGRVAWQITSSLAWNTLEAGYGGFGAQRFPYLSSGLKLTLFGSK